MACNRADCVKGEIQLSSRLAGPAELGVVAGGAGLGVGPVGGAAGSLVAAVDADDVGVGSIDFPLSSILRLLLGVELLFEG